MNPLLSEAETPAHRTLADTGVRLCDWEWSISSRQSSSIQGVLCLILLINTPFPAFAQEDGERARVCFEQAREARLAGRLEDAVIALRCSLELVPRPSTAFNLGLVLLDLNRFAEAANMFSDLLDARYGPIAPQRRAAVRGRLERAIARVGTLSIRLLEPDNAELRIDGAFRAELHAGQPHLTRLVASYHHLDIEAVGRRPLSLRLRLEPGEERAVNVLLEPLERDAVAIPQPTHHVGRPHRLWLVVIGVGVLLAAIAVGVALAFRGPQEFQDPRFGNPPT